MNLPVADGAWQSGRQEGGGRSGIAGVKASERMAAGVKPRWGNRVRPRCRIPCTLSGVAATVAHAGLTSHSAHVVPLTGEFFQ